MLPYDLPVGKPVDTFLINDWWGKGQSIVGGAISGLVVLGSITKQAEKVMRRSLLE